jgi:hypothetical protein
VTRFKQLATAASALPCRNPWIEAGARPPSFETWDRICKLYGWPQTFVAQNT